MRLDAMRRYRADKVVDAVVVGTGAGGSPLLARLATAGHGVVALKAGRNWTPEDFPADEVAASGIYWFCERLSAGETPQAFGTNSSGMGVGGSTLHWGAFCPRPDRRDLRMRSEQGGAEDWPVRTGELLPFHQDVENFIGVFGPRSYPWDAADDVKLSRHFYCCPGQSHLPRLTFGRKEPVIASTLGAQRNRTCDLRGLRSRLRRGNPGQYRPIF